jgi:hypothetical protein
MDVWMYGYVLQRDYNGKTVEQWYNRVIAKSEKDERNGRLSGHEFIQFVNDVMDFDTAKIFTLDNPKELAAALLADYKVSQATGTCFVYCLSCLCVVMGDADLEVRQALCRCRCRGWCWAVWRRLLRRCRG